MNWAIGANLFFNSMTECNVFSTFEVSWIENVAYKIRGTTCKKQTISSASHQVLTFVEAKKLFKFVWERFIVLVLGSHFGHYMANDIQNLNL